MEISPGTTVGGKYVLERPLARGGMGSVWVARHAVLGSTIAVKFLDAHLAASSLNVARFEREARAAATLDTPHVVQVHDYGVEDGTPYLVMELLRGEDLSTRLRARGRLPLGEAGRILVQMSRALRRAHDAGIVHRDLKPANVFLARIDEDEEIVKILDFGIAKETWARAEETTKTGEVFGSPHYMSPEQARAEKTVDARADVWAVGVITYRMLTGLLPFPGEAVGEVLSHVLVDSFPPLSQTAPDLPATLTGFFVRALAKKKQERFATVAELIDSFRTILGEATGRQSLSEIHAALRTLDPSAPPMPVPRSGPVARPAPPSAPRAVVTAPAISPAGALLKAGPTVVDPAKPRGAPPPPRRGPSAAVVSPGATAVPPKPAPTVVVPSKPRVPPVLKAAAPPRPPFGGDAPSRSAAGPFALPSATTLVAAAPPVASPRGATPAAAPPSSKPLAAAASVQSDLPKPNAAPGSLPAVVAPESTPRAFAPPVPVSAVPPSFAHAPRPPAGRSDSTAPTALFRPRQILTAPLPPLASIHDLAPATEKTGPSITSATSSVLPEPPPRQRSRWLIGAIAACGLLAGLIALWAVTQPATPPPARPAAPPSTETGTPVESPAPAISEKPVPAEPPPTSTAEVPPASAQPEVATEPPPGASAEPSSSVAPMRSPNRKSSGTAVQPGGAKKGAINFGF